MFLKNYLYNFQIQEQYEFINLSIVETAENCKLLRKLLQLKLLQLNMSFITLSREPYCLTYDKNSILTMLQLCEKMSMLEYGISQIQFNIQNVYGSISTLSTSSINPTQINHLDLYYLLYDIKEQWRPHPRLDLLVKYWIWYLKFLKIQTLTFMDTLSVILTIPLVNKRLAFHLYKMHNLPLLHLILWKSFHYALPHRYFASRCGMGHIIFPEDNVLSYIVSMGNFCRINTSSHVSA